MISVVVIIIGTFLQHTIIAFYRLFVQCSGELFFTFLEHTPNDSERSMRLHVSNRTRDDRECKYGIIYVIVVKSKSKINKIKSIIIKKKSKMLI